MNSEQKSKFADLLKLNKDARQVLASQLAMIDRLLLRNQELQQRAKRVLDGKVMNFPGFREFMESKEIPAVQSYTDRVLAPARYFPPFDLSVPLPLAPKEPSSDSSLSLKSRGLINIWNRLDALLLKSIVVVCKQKRYHELLQELRPLSIAVDSFDQSVPVAEQKSRFLSLKSKTLKIKENIEKLRTMELSDLLKLRGCAPDFFDDADWSGVAKNVCATVDGNDCQARWINFLNPKINKKNWSSRELNQLETLVDSSTTSGIDWSQIAAQMGNGRSPMQCALAYEELQGTNSEKPPSGKRKWTSEEDERLLKLVDLFGEDFPEIYKHMKNRDRRQCFLRFTKSLDPTIRSGRWSPEEDEALIRAVELYKHVYGQSERIRWNFIQEFVPGRTDTRCRERYMNFLAPDTDLSPISDEEKTRLIEIIDYFRENKTIEGFKGPRVDSSESPSTHLRATTVKFTEDKFPWSTVASRYFNKRPDGFLRRQYLQLVRTKEIQPLFE